MAVLMAFLPRLQLIEREIRTTVTLGFVEKSIDMFFNRSAALLIFVPIHSPAADKRQI
jgi:hypothetical protein